MARIEAGLEARPRVHLAKPRGRAMEIGVDAMENGAKQTLG